MSTPHARGSTAEGYNLKDPYNVYPACAGIHPVSGLRKATTGSLPRMRGDPPFGNIHCGTKALSTPHARGSTYAEQNIQDSEWVYPACAGIHLCSDDHNLLQLSLPRMRGDPPPRGTWSLYSRQSTPHARGSTLLPSTKGRYYVVYPACAGIHPFPARTCMVGKCLPRMRGDPPRDLEGFLIWSGSTPHARGST